MHIVVHYAEIGLKGRNRPDFEKRLRDRLRNSLEDLGTAKIGRRFGRLLVELPDSVPFEAAARRLVRVFGVAFFSRATRTGPSYEDVERAVDAFTDTREFATFGVRSRRVDKSWPFGTNEFNRRLGAHVEKRSGARVDLGAPDLWIEVHMLTGEALLLHERVRGPGGLPVGSAGRLVSMLSGGIDSPVASHMMLKRGAQLSYVHFHSAPYTDVSSQDKVRDMVARLARWSGPARLFLVPFGDIQQTLVRDAPAGPRIVLYRRFMLRLAEEIANRVDALGIVTGDSLGQVSSQTLGNLDTINRAATLPVLRPLIGLDKAEIIGLAERIGTYEISIEPDEDCCSYLMPRSPATWTRPHPVEAIERELDVDGMIKASLERAEHERIGPPHDRD